MTETVNLSIGMAEIERIDNCRMIIKGVTYEPKEHLDKKLIAFSESLQDKYVHEVEKIRGIDIHKNPYGNAYRQFEDPVEVGE